MVNRVVVGARYGLGGWVAQRVTAVVMALYTVLFAFAGLAQRPFDYGTWRAFVAQGWMRIATFLFIVALAYHAWIGMRDIVMDYVTSAGLRLTLHSVVAILLVGYVGWAVQVLGRL